MHPIFGPQCQATMFGLSKIWSWWGPLLCWLPRLDTCFATWVAYWWPSVHNASNLWTYLMLWQSPRYSYTPICSQLSEAMSLPSSELKPLHLLVIPKHCFTCQSSTLDWKLTTTPLACMHNLKCTHPTAMIDTSRSMITAQPNLRDLPFCLIHHAYNDVQLCNHLSPLLFLIILWTLTWKPKCR